MGNNLRTDDLFWADQKLREIVNRKRYHYLDVEIPTPDRYVVKTSASISGVLHIGRMSDTIRGESVCRALSDHGYKSEFIWVAEDMDPLRKIPEGVSENYAGYIGHPVAEIPDLIGCHSSYAGHHIDEYLKVLDEFVSIKLTKYSMRDEYEKGNFKPFIRRILKNLDKVIKIQNRYRESSLKPGWSPWTPICRECGKIITPRILDFEEGTIRYRCEDYKFENNLAKGCGFEGIANPLKDRGKLMWKGEWAAQWARWEVSTEGAGKEYIVPTSAWWINGEIAERVLDFPMPVPIFYEHLMIDGRKMSASLGNVVHPEEWLRFAPPHLLRFFYNKKLMKTRSFSWADLPKLYDEYDFHARVYFGEENVENEKELKHMKRLYLISQIGEVNRPIKLPFSHAAIIAQIFSDEEDIVRSLKRSGHYDKERHKEIMQRISAARNWADEHAPSENKFCILKEVKKITGMLNAGQISLLDDLGVWLSRTERNADEIQNYIYKLAKDKQIPLKRAFQAVYLSIFGTKNGPKAGTLIASLDRKWVVERFRKVSS